MQQYIEFIIKRNNAEIAGFVNAEEIDDDECIQFYNHQGFENGYNLPKNPFDDLSDDWADYEKLVEEWSTDSMFLQYLWDYRDEDAVLERNGYTLFVNEGEKALKKTSIKVSQLTKEKLDAMKVHPRETYEQVIIRLLSDD